MKRASTLNARAEESYVYSTFLKRKERKRETHARAKEL